MLQLHELFLTALDNRNMELPEHTIENHDRWFLTISAKSEDVGKLTIWDDGDELTVDLGEKHHCHFDEHTAPGSTQRERREFVADTTAEFVNDVLNDRVSFRVEYKAGRCRSSFSWTAPSSSIASPSSHCDEYIEFRWSGVYLKNGT